MTAGMWAAEHDTLQAKGSGSHGWLLVALNVPTLNAGLLLIAGVSITMKAVVQLQAYHEAVTRAHVPALKVQRAPYTAVHSCLMRKTHVSESCIYTQSIYLSAWSRKPAAAITKLA